MVTRKIILRVTVDITFSNILLDADYATTWNGPSFRVLGKSKLGTFVSGFPSMLSVADCPLLIMECDSRT